MNKTVLTVIAAGGVALAVAGGYWIGTQRAPTSSTAASDKGAAKSAAASGGPVNVEAVKVAYQRMPQTITAVGSLRSDESITLRPEVAGRIASIAFQEGQRVAKGAMLVRLDPAINEAEVQQAKANLKLAQSKYDRAVDLAKSNFISGQAKDEAENNLRVAEAAVALAAARRDKMEIRAPFSGIIGLRVVSVGDYVKEGADMVNLESIDPLEGRLPRAGELSQRRCQVGQSLTVALDALPGKTFEGKVFALNPLVDAAGRSIVIRAHGAQSGHDAAPGHVRARAASSPATRRTRSSFPSRRSCRRARSSSCSASSTARRRAARSRWGSGATRKVEIAEGLDARPTPW